jgi:hypothetical protein
MLVLYRKDDEVYLDVELVSWVRLVDNACRTLTDYVFVNGNNCGRKVSPFLDSVYGCWYG